MSYTPGIKLFEATADKTITNTVSESSIISTGIGATTLQPADFYPGMSLEYLVRGVYSAIAIVPSLTIKLKLNNVTIATATISNLLALASNSPFEARATIACRVAGASGVVAVNGKIDYSVSGITWNSTVLDNAGSAVNVNLSSASIPFDITATWGSANAGNILKVNQLRVLKL